jgi:hypothetical protein
MLNHSKITTTVKYAHVVDDEVAAALQARAPPVMKPEPIPPRDPRLRP